MINLLMKCGKMKDLKEFHHLILKEFVACFVIIQKKII